MQKRSRVFLMGWKGYALVATCGLPVAIAAQGRTLSVTVTDEIAAPVAAIAREYEKVKPGVSVQVSVKSGSGLVTGSQIMLAPTQQIPRGTLAPRMFARDPLVVVARSEDSRIEKLSHLGLSIDLALPTKASLVGGHVAELTKLAGASYGQAWLQNFEQNSKRILPTPLLVMQSVLSGSADAGIVTLSSATPRDEKLKIVNLPIELAPSIQYLAAIRQGSPDPTLSKHFVEFLFSNGNQLRLEASGFISPLRPPPELTISKPSGMLKLFTHAIGTIKKETVSAIDGSGKTKSYTGASLREILKGEQGGMVTFVGADLRQVKVPMATIRASGAVIVEMENKNFQVIFGQKPSTQWLRWLRRIDVS